MDYVMGLSFEEAANFPMLKALITQAADEAGLDIFDNIFDWSILLTDQKRIKSGKIGKTEQLSQAVKKKVSSNGDMIPKLGNNNMID